jgi:hypothetical protein
MSILLANRIRGVTTNVALGFGSFDEKPLQPFVSEAINGTVLPDSMTGALPYSFRHTVSLTNDSTEFSVSYVYI